MDIIWYPHIKDIPRKNTDKYTIAKDVLYVDKEKNESKIIKRYTKFKTESDIENFINSQPKNKRYFYEVIEGYTPQKLKFDIDKKSSDTNEGIQILKDVLKSIWLSFKEIYNIELENDDITVFSSTRKDKQSFHIVIQNYMVDDNHEAKTFYELSLNYIDIKNKDDESHIVDPSVYSSLQCFRMMNCHKFGIVEGTKKSIRISFKPTKDKLILTNDKIPFEKSLITYTYNCKELPCIETEGKRAWRRNKFLSFCVDEHLQAYEIWINIGNNREIFTFQSSMKNYIQLTRLKPSFCEFCERIHDGESGMTGTYLTISKNGVIYEHCRRDIHHKSKRIGLLDSYESVEKDTVIKHLFREDEGIAHILHQEYKDRIVFIDSKRGYKFNQENFLWEEMTTLNILHSITPFIENLCDHYIYIFTEKSKTNKEDYTKYENYMKTIRRIRTKVLSASSKSILPKLEPKVLNSKFEEKINIKHHLFPIRDGKVFNFKKGDVEDRQIIDYFTFECPVDISYNEEKTNKVINFLSQIFVAKEKIKVKDEKIDKIVINNKKSKDYLDIIQICLGYTLTGETSDRSFSLWLGSGSNGKGTIVRFLEKIMGNFYSAVSSDVFISRGRNAGAHTSYLNAIKGKRAVSYSETRKGEELNDALIKAISASDTVSSREFQCKQGTFRPFSKLILQTNDPPLFRLEDQAIIDRLRYIPFQQRFSTNPIEGEILKDDSVVDYIENECLDELFTWMAKGATTFYTDKKIKECAYLEDKKKEFMKEVDAVGTFIDERCEKGDYQVQSSLLYKAFKNFVSESDFECYLGMPAFKKRLENEGYKYSKSDVIYVNGLKIKK